MAFETKKKVIREEKCLKGSELGEMVWRIQGSSEESSSWETFRDGRV